MALEQMDVKTAFLHGDLEQIYMEQPEVQSTCTGALGL
jgi:hypothetical protein